MLCDPQDTKIQVDHIYPAHQHGRLRFLQRPCHSTAVDLLLLSDRRALLAQIVRSLQVVSNSQLLCQYVLDDVHRYRPLHADPAPAQQGPENEQVLLLRHHLAGGRSVLTDYSFQHANQRVLRSQAPDFLSNRFSGRRSACFHSEKAPDCRPDCLTISGSSPGHHLPLLDHLEHDPEARDRWQSGGHEQKKAILEKEKETYSDADHRCLGVHCGLGASARHTFRQLLHRSAFAKILQLR